MKVFDFIRHPVWNRTPTGRDLLLLCCAFCGALLAFRIGYTGERRFLFLAWNLFLAALPWLLSRRLLRPLSRGWFRAGALTWLLFLPNSFYILTDLFHLAHGASAPLWYDLALLLAFAWTGVLFGVQSVQQVEEAVWLRTGHRPGWWIAVPLMALNAFGIYLGRFLRFNSWDVLANPLELAGEMLQLFLHPFHNRFDWGMIVSYTVLLTVIYWSIPQAAKDRE